MEEKHITIQDASQFVRDLIELGGVYKVDSTDFIVSTVDGTAVTLEVKGQNKPIMIWSEKAKLGNHVLLNIFGETVNTTDERNWFYTFIGMLPGHILRNMMTAIINAALSKDDKQNYESLEAISPFVKDIDEKTKSELNLLSARDIGVIVYHKPSKTAQLQTKIFEEDFRNSFGKKIRGKTWKLFEAMFKALMGIENEQQMSDTFKISADILGMKQTDAMVRVAVKFAENVDAFAKVLLGQEFKLGSLLEGIKNLEVFFGIMRVFTSGGGQKIESKAPAASPFGKPANPVPQKSQSAGRVVSVGGGMPIVLPDVVGSGKLPPPPSTAPINMPDVLHPGRTIPVGGNMPQNQSQFAAQMTAYGYPAYNPIAHLGKPISLTPAGQIRSEGPRVRQILANGKIV